MTKPKRSYSPNTLKVLFALSGNQCAHPNCRNSLIEPATEESGALVVGHICHIFAISTNGPRGKLGLTEKELNAPENLVLLCRNHHAVVDGQHESYPADLLKTWKSEHEEKIKKRILLDINSINLDVFGNSYFPRELVDQKIKLDTSILRKSRYFSEFDSNGFAKTLGFHISNGELSGGSNFVRCLGLSWCARILSRTASELAEQFLALAKSLGQIESVEVAAAFLNSQKGDKGAALSMLAKIDSSSARSAAFIIVAYHDGADKAVNWLRTAQVTPGDLDSDGKQVLLSQFFLLRNWIVAKETLDAISEADLLETPALNHMVAMIHLMEAVPTEFQSVLLSQLPFEASNFPLASDASSLASRRDAREWFQRAAKAAFDLGLKNAALVDDEYALWLDLKDPRDFPEARKRLENRIRDARTGMRLVPLGLQFGVKLDIAALELEIEKQIALNGGMTQDLAVARLAIAFTLSTPQLIANYISKHYEELSGHLNTQSLRFFLIEVLAKAGRVRESNEILQELVDEGISEADQGRLRVLISEATGRNPVDARKEQFEKTNSLNDLINLVDELEKQEEWENICKYGKNLFDRTHSIRDAERWVAALDKSHQYAQLVEVVREQEGLLEQSKILRLLFCWALYYEGKLIDARAELLKSREADEGKNHRVLKVHLAIALGDWKSLSSFVAEEFFRVGERSAQELISTAHLALQIGSPHAKDLMFQATAKGNDDPQILSAAYFLATSAGWEQDPTIVEWLQKAVSLSREDGPLHKVTLKEMLDWKPEWDRRTSETSNLLARGEIPIFLAARSLNRSLVELTSFSAFSNYSVNDPRHRVLIPAFSGKRAVTATRSSGVIGFDPTALLTLSQLNLLEFVLSSIDQIYIPHSTLSWLFGEKQRSLFHQPSRIKEAHKFRHLLSIGMVDGFSATTVADSELANEIGDELALLVAEAEKGNKEGVSKCFVVRPAPVHRLSSFMEEEADLGRFSSIMSGCTAVVQKLRRKGQITAEEDKHAQLYLRFHEKGWNSQPDLPDGAVLYLDELSVTYLLHIGMLGKLRGAGLRPIVSTRSQSEANSLIAYEEIAGKIADSIEHLRKTLSSGIESGKIKVGRKRWIEGVGDATEPEGPTVELVGNPEGCDAVVVDDRFLNQHEYIESPNAKVAILSSLDFLDSMRSSEIDKWMEFRTLLRRFGFAFVPIEESEITHHLCSSDVTDGTLVETAELKAIRENILGIRMTNILQLPKEAFWLDNVFKVLIKSLRAQWDSDSTLVEIRSRADWLLNQLEIQGWAHRLVIANSEQLSTLGRGPYILLIVTPSSEMSDSRRLEFWKWTEERILVPIKEQNAALYSWIVQQQKNQLTMIVNAEFNDDGK